MIELGMNVGAYVFTIEHFLKVALFIHVEDLYGH